jgi:hypothetical protein
MKSTAHKINIQIKNVHRIFFLNKYFKELNLELIIVIVIV